MLDQARTQQRNNQHAGRDTVAERERVDELFSELDSSKQGLSDEDARRRLEQYRANALAQAKRHGLIVKMVTGDNVPSGNLRFADFCCPLPGVQRRTTAIADFSEAGGGRAPDINGSAH